MPRLSKKEYWKQHKTLRWLWLNHQSIYGYLTPWQQWNIHDFFQPSKDLSREELLTHRKTISKDRPSLPHQAGWALKELNAVLGAPVTVGTGKKTGKIIVRSVVRPEIDEAKLMLAYKMIIKRILKEEAGLDLPEDILPDS